MGTKWAVQCEEKTCRKYSMRTSAITWDFLHLALLVLAAARQLAQACKSGPANLDEQ